MPDLVEAAARSIAGSNLTILNGAQGVNEMIAGLVGQGLSVLDVLRKSTADAAASSTLPAPVASTRTAGRG
jgi:hypothetical protein